MTETRTPSPIPAAPPKTGNLTPIKTLKTPLRPPRLSGDNSFTAKTPRSQSIIEGLRHANQDSYIRHELHKFSRRNDATDIRIPKTVTDTGRATENREPIKPLKSLCALSASAVSLFNYRKDAKVAKIY